MPEEKPETKTVRVLRNIVQRSHNWATGWHFVECTWILPFWLDIKRCFLNSLHAREHTVFNLVLSGFHLMASQVFRNLEEIYFQTLDSVWLKKAWDCQTLNTFREPWKYLLYSFQGWGWGGGGLRAVPSMHWQSLDIGWWGEYREQGRYIELISHSQWDTLFRQRGQWQADKTLSKKLDQWKDM